MSPRRRRLACLATVILGVNLLLGVTPDRVQADVSAPSWWNGDCDANNNPGSSPLGASYNGVKACGGGTDRLVRFFNGAWGEYEWQCVELSMRYMYLVYGIAPYSANGKEVVNNYPGSVLSKVTNN